MSAFPLLSVNVGFASNPYDATPTFTPLGPGGSRGPGHLGWVRSVKCKRGRERLLRSQSQFQAGTATVTLDNRGRRFDPTNAAGPYYPNVQPEKLIQIGATWASVFYPIWTGYIDDWPQVWPGMQESNVPVPCTDAFKHFSVARLLSSGYEAAVMADNPTAYYRLGDPLGSTTAVDSSGNGFDAQVQYAVTFGETGAMPADAGTAALFGGTAPAGQVVLPTGIFGGGGVSIECWVKCPTITSLFGVVILTSPNNGHDWVLELAPSGVLAVTAGGVTLLGATNIADGNWHHIVASVSNSGASLTSLYVDGAAFADAAVLGPSVPWPNEPGTTIGSFGLNVDNIEIQELAIYNTGLNHAQVMNHWLAGAWPAQYTGQYVAQVLETIGFPGTFQAVDAGRTFCQADTQDETQTKVLDMLQKLEQTEQGQCFIGCDGKLNFQDRYRRFEYPNANSVATFGDGGAAFPTEIPYVMGGVGLSYDRVELWNDVVVTRRNGNLQRAINPTSVQLFTDRTMPGLSDLMMALDSDADYCAEWILTETAFPLFRVSSLILDPFSNPALWPLVLGSEIGTVITVNKHNIPGGGSPISLVCRIEGIEHDISPPNSWKTTWHVSLMGANMWGIYNDSVMGVWGGGACYGW